MDIDKYISLKEKHRHGKISKDEQEVLQQWVQSAEGRSLQKINQLSDSYKKDYEPNIEAGWSRLKARMEEAKAQEMPIKTLRVASNRRWINAAAAVLLLAVALVAMRGWLKPAPETIIVSTNVKENRALTLTDGTKVQLNAASKITLPESFENADKRIVQLSGEAYFAVKSIVDQPFEIKTTGVTITAVGTAFNVRAYPQEETTEVEVEEGKVEMSVGAQKILLLAHEKGIYNSRENKLYKRKAQQLNAQAWHTHRLVFRKASLSEILQELARYHHVQLELAKESLKDCVFTCNFGKTKLEDALQVLQFGLQLQWEKVSDDHYIIQNGICQ